MLSQSFYIILVAALILTGWYGVKIFSNRRSVLPLQWGIFAIIVVTFVEQAVWALNHNLYNSSGYTPEVVSVLGSLLSAMKEAGLRVVLLLVSHGFSITRHAPSSP